ncbi:MAG: bacteriohemerythrin [Roseburia sp.]
MTIEFDDTLITKNELIDSQHKELIDRIKKFVDSCEQRDSKVTAINMLDYLAEYTDFHFSAEEKLQEEVGYPGLEDHKKKHEEFKKSLCSLEEFLEESEGPTDAFVEQVKKKVVDWLFNHIKTFDRSVAEYIFIIENPDRL